MKQTVSLVNAKHKKGYWVKRIRESLPWWILLLPGLTYLLIFGYGPMYGILMAFQNYRPRRGISGSEWVGLEHFIRFINYPYFWRLIRNTLSLTLYSIAVFPLPIIFALLLNEIKSVRFKKVTQMITYMPHFLSEVVVCSIVILFLDRTSGPINNLIALFGGTRTNFMGIPEAFSTIFTFSGVWQGLGWSAILYISALSSISQEEVEAARIDGASRFQVIRHINIPGILPTIMITFIMKLGSIMSVGYSKVLLLQNDMNMETSNVISLYTYEMGLVGGQYSYTTAIGLFNNVINIIILLAADRVSKKLTDTGLF